MRILLERARWYVASLANVATDPPRRCQAKGRASCGVFVGLVASFNLTATAFAGDVCVFTDQAHPVRVGDGTRVILLDARARLLASLGASLPADSQRATELVTTRLKEGGPALQREFAAAYQGVIDAWRLGLTKIPAVVVDHRYVVYGEADVARALSWIDTYRSAHP